MNEALEGSIKKWKAIVRSTKALDDGTGNCPLCKEHYRDDCKGCPVRIKVNVRHCIDTPHDTWCDHQYNIHNRDSLNHRIPHCKECLRLAREELKFLESLREG